MGKHGHPSLEKVLENNWGQSKNQKSGQSKLLGREKFTLTPLL